MGCHTWFFRPTEENEIAVDTCEFSQEVFEGDLYTNIDTPHDLFRIDNYVDSKLLSLYETMEFIKNNKDKIWFSENWEDELKKFWHENPNGVIEFG